MKGFTLIETLFAVLIFSASLIALMAIAGRGISATLMARDQGTASYLAQEGLEVVRNMRDTNTLGGGAWDAGFSVCTVGNPVCGVMYTPGQTPVVGACSAFDASGCMVYRDIQGFFWDTATNASLSPFRRTITVVPLDADLGVNHQYQVTTKVYWTTKGLDRSVDLKTVIKKWQ
jgi:type II secretory pathway pseudopilin PulG